MKLKKFSFLLLLLLLVFTVFFIQDSKTAMAIPITDPFPPPTTPDGDSYEYNDSTYYATRIGYTSTYDATRSYGDIHTSSDIDYFYFNLIYESTVIIRLDNIPSGNDYDLKLYNESKSLLGSSTLGSNSSEKIEKVLQPGKYYIKIYSYYGYSSSNYKLSVEEFGAPTPFSQSDGASWDYDPEKSYNYLQHHEYKVRTILYINYNQSLYNEIMDVINLHKDIYKFQHIHPGVSIAKASVSYVLDMYEGYINDKICDGSKLCLFLQDVINKTEPGYADTHSLEEAIDDVIASALDVYVLSNQALNYLQNVVNIAIWLSAEINYVQLQNELDDLISYVNQAKLTGKNIQFTFSGRFQSIDGIDCTNVDVNQYTSEITYAELIRDRVFGNVNTLNSDQIIDKLSERFGGIPIEFGNIDFYHETSMRYHTDDNINSNTEEFGMYDNNLRYMETRTYMSWLYPYQ